MPINSVPSITVCPRSQYSISGTLHENITSQQNHIPGFLRQDTMTRLLRHAKTKTLTGNKSVREQMGHGDRLPFADTVSEKSAAAAFVIV